MGRDRVLILLIAFILIVSGCDTDSEKSVTGDFTIHEARGVSVVNLSPDSLTVTARFRKNIGNSSYALAGRYEGAEAFAVFRFRLSSSQKEMLTGAYLKLDLEDVWRDGEAEFELFATHSEWADSLMLDPEDFLNGLGAPLAAASDTASVFSTLSFTLDPEVVSSWDDVGSLLVKSSDAGGSMISILTDDTNYPPVLKLIKRTVDGVVDTVGVTAEEGTYFFSHGLDGESPVISEGDGSGYVLRIGLPAELPPYATINRCILKMRILESVIPETFSVGIYKLDGEFTSIGEAEKDMDTRIRITLSPDADTYELDIAKIANDWHVGGESNYGLLIEPVAEGNSPDFCVFAPKDSLEITFTPLPKIK